MEFPNGLQKIPNSLKEYFPTTNPFSTPIGIPTKPLKDYYPGMFKPQTQEESLKKFQDRFPTKPLKEYYPGMLKDLETLQIGK